MLSNALIGILTAYACLCVAAFLLQRSMIYFRTPASLPATPHIELHTDAGKVLARTRILANSSGAVVYFGGNAEDVSATLPEFAAKLPRHSLYFLHYRGYGGSEGAPSEAALLADALALFDRVHAAHPHVALVGRSLGSSLAVSVASGRPQAVSALILLTPFDSLLEVAAHHYPFLPVRWLLRDKYESWRWAPQVTAKTLMVAASQDEVVPQQSTERLHRQFAPGVAKLSVIAGASHNSLEACPEEAVRFLEGALAGNP